MSPAAMTRIPIPGEGGLSFFGIRDRNLRSLEDALGLTLASRGDVLLAEGPADRCGLLAAALEGLASLDRESREKGQRFRIADVRAALRILEQDPGASLREYFVDTVITPATGKSVRARSVRQLDYLRALKAKDLVLGVGPAGTGKTWLAMAVAVEALGAGQVRRIVLTRPAVEAGEKLGFLPGDLIDKVDPYLRPLYDALHDMMDAEKAQRLRERGVIEIAPLAFMRGRTLNDSFIILDEAQNTTSEQMKMFLTRMGNGTRAVVTGDLTQNDLPPGRVSGLTESLGVIGDLDGVGVVRFEESDVVRHRLVQAIVRAYATNALSRRRRLERRRPEVSGETRGSGETEGFGENEAPGETGEPFVAGEADRRRTGPPSAEAPVPAAVAEAN